jgi:hypothetical protein
LQASQHILMDSSLDKIGSQNQPFRVPGQYSRPDLVPLQWLDLTFEDTRCSTECNANYYFGLLRFWCIRPDLRAQRGRRGNRFKSSRARLMSMSEKKVLFDLCML